VKGKKKEKTRKTTSLLIDAFADAELRSRACIRLCLAVGNPESIAISSASVVYSERPRYTGCGKDYCLGSRLLSTFIRIRVLLLKFIFRMLAKANRSRICFSLRVSCSSARRLRRGANHSIENPMMKIVPI
jgi:hypothetical protein